MRYKILKMFLKWFIAEQLERNADNSSDLVDCALAIIDSINSGDVDNG